MTWGAEADGSHGLRLQRTQRAVKSLRTVPTPSYKDLGGNACHTALICGCRNQSVLARPLIPKIRVIRGSTFFGASMPDSNCYLRQRAHERQSGRCYYCQFPMWLTAAERIILYGDLSAAAARRFQCSAEHLVPVSQGGRNSAENVVAACLFCNRTRHRTKKVQSHYAYERYVRKRVHAGRWHPRSVTRRNQRTIRNEPCETVVRQQSTVRSRSDRMAT